MEKGNQILDILRLYEYSMSIGKSLSYFENCDQFLKLLLKRRDLNACWVLRQNKNNFINEYSIPLGEQRRYVLSPELNSFLEEIDTYKLLEYSDMLKETTTIDIEAGYVAIYKLKDHGYLFLYSKEDNINRKELSQLLPVVDKFAITLKACRAYANQKTLLYRLEERNTELNNYAHVVSHDLKSPLRNIDALATWLKEDHGDKLDTGATEYLNLISDNITKMEDLITGILEYSTVGIKDQNTTPINLNEIVGDVLKFLYVPDHVKIKISENFPTVMGDTHRLQQLFQNLIGNAIKYNDKEQGEIEVGFKTLDTHYEFFVKDNGKGIEEKYFKKIFNVFQKLENTKDSSGIGLSIVEKIISAYSGKIWLVSEVGKGTTFYFTLKK